MTRDNVKTSVAHSELLAEITTEAFAPAVHADGVAAERQPVAARVQPVTQIIVVAVPESLVEKPDLVQGACAIGGVARADMVHKGTPDA